jgi:hypothetical protein
MIRTPVSPARRWARSNIRAPVSPARCSALSTICAAVLLACALPSPAGAAQPSAQPSVPPLARSATAPGLGYSPTPSTTEPYTPCPPGAGRIECNLIVDPPPIKTKSGYRLPGGGPLLEGSGEKGGYAPKDLQSAYRIPTSGGATQTVAIIDAYGDKYAESDLAKYREKYELPACTKKGGCFNKVNERGEETFSLPETGEIEIKWGAETSLDMEMVSAACPNCHILLVEATNQNPSDTANSLGEAVKLGATEIGNSYGYPENDAKLCPKEKGCSEYLAAYNHPGIPVTVSAGDSGYDDGSGGAPNWPATSPNVIAVGGTNLMKATSSRGWSETAWRPSGSGCSLYESKPAWQTDTGCARRTGNDVAAVAEEVSVYSTPLSGGWANFGGTSVGAPLIAGIEAHASGATKAEGAEAFYRSTLFDVAAGADGVCGGGYLCTGEEGYDGPTGWGAPNGPPEVAAGFQAITAPATGITSTGVKLNGYVNPAGLKTTYHMEYGATTSYGTTVPMPEAKVGSGAIWQAVGQSIAGLGGSYHYRVVANSSSGTSYGEDHTFATIPWAIHKTPNPSGSWESRLEGVSCSSSTACIAVASYAEEENTEKITRWPLAERWSGTEWQIQSTPKPTGATLAVLNGVSCSSAGACTAVGYDLTKAGAIATVAERWDGKEWVVQSTPNPTKLSLLHSVSCSSANACTAVGQYTNSAGSKVTLAESWNGTEWVVQSTPNPTGATWSELRGVSCSSSSACTAVGFYQTNSSIATMLAEGWNGKEWVVQTTPNPTGAKASELNGVSCPSSGACTAVGSYQNSENNAMTLAEGWNGKEWVVQSTPNPARTTESSLSGVSCSAAGACIAVGWDLHNPGETALAERWDGTEWSIQGSPEPEEPLGYESASLYGVSCPSSAACDAVGTHVGYTKGAFGFFVTLAEAFTFPLAETEAATSVTEGGATLNGSVNPDGQETTYRFEYGKTTAYGTSVPVPDASVGSGSSSVKVSHAIAGLASGTTYHFRVVATDSSGIAAGPDGVFTTLASWRLTSTPNPSGAKASKLQKVSCTSAAACTAVGRYTNSSGSGQTLAEVWNGTEWKEQATPNPTKAKKSALEGVSCASAGACTAVGVYENSSGTSVPLAESWNGEKWSIQEPPAPTGAKESGLFDVSCTSSSACVAVGAYANSAGTYLTLAEGWNGTSWSIEETPPPTGAKFSQLAGVSCTTASACTAAGEYQNSTGTVLTVAEVYNGEKWAIQETPKVSGATIAWFEGVSCTSSSACTAVGYDHNSEGINVLLAERWNGTAWSVQSTPSPTGFLGGELREVSCTSSTACTAVGGYASGKPQDELSLAEFWNGTEWSIQSTPNPSGAPFNLLHGVSCTSFTACATVGDYYKSRTSEESLTLAEIYD